MIWLTPKPSQSFFLYLIQSNEKNYLQKKSFFLKKRRSGDFKKKRKEGTFIAIKKDPTTLIRKYANKLKVHWETVKTTIKQDLSPDLNSLEYALYDVIESKTNTTSHPNIGSLKTSIEGEWNRMFEVIILKVCKSFQRHVDTMN